MPREPIPIEPDPEDQSAEPEEAADPTPEPDPITWTVTNADGEQSSATVYDLAVVEAMLDQLANEQNIWDFIDRIQHVYHVPPQYRQRFYEQLISMVAMREPSEQDALLVQAQPVFRYRIETARRDVAALHGTQGTSIRIQPMVVGDDFIAEIIHVPNEVTSVQYLRYNTADGTTAVEDRITLGNITYMPPQTRLVDNGTLLLATGVEEYGETTMDLLRDVRACIDDFVYIESVAYRNLAAYYVLLSWIFDRFDVVPYLRAQGEFGTGKTRFLKVIAALCYRSVVTSGATTASPIFRIIERFHGTLSIDEADHSQQNEMWMEITKLLNVGYERGGMVLRAERKTSNDQYDAESYDCYGPKILATRRRFNDQALESRCLSYTMPIGRVPAKIPLFLTTEFRERARVLRNKLLLWRFRNFHTVTADPREHFVNLDNRLNQILLPLLAVSDDQRLRREILDHAQRYQLHIREDRRDSWEGKVAYCLMEAWHARTDKTGFQVRMKSVNDRVKMELDDVRIDARRIGEMVRHTFNLTTAQRGGSVWITVSERDVRKLCAAYAIANEKYLEALPSRIEVRDVPNAAPLSSNNGVPRVPREPVR